MRILIKLNLISRRRGLIFKHFMVKTKILHQTHTRRECSVKFCDLICLVCQNFFWFVNFLIKKACLMQNTHRNVTPQALKRRDFIESSRNDCKVETANYHQITVYMPTSSS